MEQGRHRRQETHQGNETLTIAADEKPVPIRLIVRKAIYGDVAGGTTKDVTTNVADMVKDNTLSITPGNALFGDPTKGQAKQLSVDYTFDGAAKSKTGPRPDQDRTKTGQDRTRPDKTGQDRTRPDKTGDDGQPFTISATGQ